jgi:hypothetical protein
MINTLQFLLLLLVATGAFPSPAEPRDSAETLDGIAHLGRCADKAELDNESRLPMDLQYPCPKDEAVLSLLEISSVEFSNLVSESNDDSALAAKLKERNPASFAQAQQGSVLSFRFLLKHNNNPIKLRNNDGC